VIRLRYLSLIVVLIAARCIVPLHVASVDAQSVTQAACTGRLAGAVQRQGPFGLVAGEWQRSLYRGSTVPSSARP